MRNISIALTLLSAIACAGYVGTAVSASTSAVKSPPRDELSPLPATANGQGRILAWSASGNKDWIQRQNR